MITIAASEVQNAFALGVHREPVVAIHLLPPGHERRMQVFAAFARVVGNHAPIRHHDLQVGRVHPDAAQQVALLLLDDFWAHIEDVAIDLVHLLPSHVFHVVLADILGGQHKRVSVLDVLKIGWRHLHARQRVFRRIDDFFRALAGEVEDHVVNLVALAIDFVVVVDGLHAGNAAISVVVQRLLELALLGGELLDDLIRRYGGRRRCPCVRIRNPAPWA